MSTDLPNPPGGHTAYGITIHHLAEDSLEVADLIAFGHHDMRRFLAACQHYARSEWGWCNLADDSALTYREALADIVHEHAVFTDDPEEMDSDADRFDWVVIIQPEPGPGTVPITRWRA